MAEVAFPGPPSRSGETICTLFDGDFHFGLAAMLNSLVRAGYKGTVWAGYRGALPPWVNQLQPADGPDDSYLVTEQIRVVFVLLETRIHLALYKPQFMLDLLANHARGCQYIWFFDSDIFLRGTWSFFVNWQRYGIAVCQDILHHVLPEHDPLRQEWAEIAAGMGLGKPRSLMQYFNSGLVGVPAAQAGFLQSWQRLIEQAGKMGMDLNRLTTGTRDMPFHIPDQDALNVAVMVTEYPLAPTGPEIMGFRPGRPVTYHAVGTKPWRGSVLLRALAGEAPSGAAKFYFTQVSSPIRLYSWLDFRRKRLECAVGGFIGRFYRRA